VHLNVGSTSCLVELAAIVTSSLWINMSRITGVSSWLAVLACYAVSHPATIRTGFPQLDCDRKSQIKGDDFTLNKTAMVQRLGVRLMKGSHLKILIRSA
jgi:hypothetical protein